MDATSNQRFDLNCVTIGVLTALEEEYAACLDVFDPDRNGGEHQRRATSGTFTCWLCRVPPRRGDGCHVVAITLLPDMGNNAAPIAANILLQHCSEVRYLIMCGIAGAVPNPDKCDDHVRLGDIVVSNGDGLIQHDRGKQRDPRLYEADMTDAAGSTPDPLAGFELRSPPRSPSPDLLAAVRRMHADELLLKREEYRDWEVKIGDFLKRCSDPEKWKRPYHTMDRLVDTPDGTEPSRKHPKDRARRRVDGIVCPRVFRGPIGAANIVLADPLRRDALRDRRGIKAVEMETSGVADASWVAGVGYLAVRGTCDYCNSTKADGWHEYAALIAACYAKTVIEYVHPIKPSSETVAPSHPTPTGTATLTDEIAHARHGFHALAIAGRQAASNIVPDSFGPNLTDETVPSTTIIQSPASVGIDLGTDEPMVSREKFMAPDLQSVATKDTLADLITKIDELSNEHRWSEIAPLADDLEKRLRSLPRKGSEVRQGWIVLARLEEQQQREARLRGRAIDVSRMRDLRREAENVID